MNKLAKKFTTLAISVATLFAVAVPVYASTITIDYQNEEITGLTKSHEFSFDNKSWNYIYSEDTAVDISSIVNAKNEVTLYYRNADGSGSTADLDIPARPAAPMGVAFVPGADPSLDKITTSSTQEYKVGNSVWIPSPDEGVAVEAALVNGAAFSVRTAATSSDFASEEVKVSVPKQAAKPASVKYDFKKDTVSVATTMEYQVAAARSADDIKNNKITVDSSKWKSVSSTALTRSALATELGDETGASALTVYARIKATSTKSASQVAAVDIPSVVGAPTSVKIDVSDEKLTGLTTAMEYRVLTSKNETSATLTSPAWKAVTSKTLNLSKVFSAATAKTPNTMIQVRFKAVAQKGTKAAVPSSAIQAIGIATRPATPKAADIVMDYTAGSEKMIIPEAYEYQYAGETKWNNGSEDISIASKIPATGSKALAVKVRVKAIESGSNEQEFVPASAAISSIKIPAQRKAPKSTYKAKTNRVTGVSAKMEYAIGSSNDFVPVTGKFIDLSDQGDGTTVTVKVRLMSTAKAPVSAVTEVKCVIPAAK